MPLYSILGDRARLCLKTNKLIFFISCSHLLKAAWDVGIFIQMLQMNKLRLKGLLEATQELMSQIQD